MKKKVVMAMLRPFKKAGSVSSLTEAKTEISIKTLAQLALEELRLEKLLRRTRNYALTFLLLSTATLLKGQEQNSLSAIKVGDKVSEDFWKTQHQFYSGGKQIRQSLSSYKGRLLIIDFWATWCGSCIAAFPKFDNLKKKFGADINFIPVSREGFDKISAFYQKKSTIKITESNSIISDSLLNKTFPHRLIPHCAWINSDGEVVAFTSSYDINEENISKILSKQKVAIALKHDVDPNRPLFSSEQFPIDRATTYAVFFKGNITGLPSGMRERNNDNLQGVAMTNTSILDMYKAWAGRFQNFWNYKAMDVEVLDMTKITFSGNPVNKEKWEQENLYNFDFWMNKKDDRPLSDVVRLFLNTNTGLDVSIASKRKQFLSLSKYSPQTTLHSPETDYRFDKVSGFNRFRKVPVSQLVSWLNEEIKVGLPVVNETGYCGNIDADIISDGTLETINRSLKKHGLKLIPKTGKIPVLTIRDNLDHTKNAKKHES